MAKLDDVPEELVHRLGQEAHQKQSDAVRTRSDLWSLCLATNSDIDKVDPVALFWNLHHPRLITWNELDNLLTPIPRLSGELGGLALECLEHLENRFKPLYEPDESDTELRDYFNDLGNLTPTDSTEGMAIPTKLMKLVVYLHVIAARALTMKEIQGHRLSEEVLTCLSEAEGTIDRLERVGMNGTSLHMSLFQISSLAVSARVFVELSRVRHSEGSLPNALRFLAKAGDYQYHVQAALESRLVNDNWGSESTSNLPFSFPLDLRLLWEEEGIGDLSPQDVVSTFLSLKKTGGVEDWQRIRQCCQTLAECEVMFRQYDPKIVKSVALQDVDNEGNIEHNTMRVTALVEDEEGIELTWLQFWYGAKAWVDAQLSPSEYKKMQEYDKTHESEERLKSYFFGGNWNILPEPAQLHLINADRIWCSPETGAIQMVLNEILRATETACHKFIREPLADNVGEVHLRDLLQPIQTSHFINRALSIRDYIRLCESKCFRDFLGRRHVPQDDTLFLTQDLPAAMRKLADARNRAEHEHETTWYRADVEEYFGGFLGIGQKGILPELVGIGRHLRFRRPK